jgi:hypothetical protein
MEEGKDYYVVQLNVKDFSGNQIDSGDAIKYWADDKGKWIDCVFDVTSIGYVTEMSVRFDVRRDELDAYINSPAGEFFLDAIAINASEEPRVTVDAPTAIAKPKKDLTKIFSTDRNIVVLGSVSYIEVYNTMGSLVKRVPATGLRTDIPFGNSGVFVVKTVSTNGSVFKSKVLIK